MLALNFYYITYLLQRKVCHMYTIAENINKNVIYCEKRPLMRKRIISEKIKILVCELE